MRQTNKTDREIKDLVRLAQKGYRGAMEELVRLSEDLVYYNCLRMLKNQEDARDMTQEVFLTVYEKLSTLKKGEAFFKWIKIITINKCKNKLKQGNPYFLLEDLTQMDEPTDAMELVEDKSDQSSPEKVLDTKETESTLLKLISELPDAQRMCIVMFYYDDMSINEIATVFGVSQNTIKSRLTYAKAKLREGIQRESHEGFNLHGYQPAAFTAFVAYYLKNTAKPDDGRIGTLMKALRDFAMSAASGLDTAVIVSAADAVIAEEAAALCAAGASSSVAAAGGLSTIFGAAFWGSLGGKALLTASAALLVAGGVFGTWKLAGKGLEGRQNSSIIEVSESTQIQITEIEVISEISAEDSQNSLRSLRGEPASSDTSEESESVESSEPTESSQTIAEQTSSEESSEIMTQTSQEDSGENSSQIYFEESSESSSEESSQESLQDSSEESSQESSQESSEESSEESSQESSEDSSEESSEESEIVPIVPTTDVDPPPPGEYLFKHQKWDEFMGAFNTFQEAKEEAAALDKETLEIYSLLEEEGDEFTYQGTTMTRDELRALYYSKKEERQEIDLQSLCQNAKSAFNEWSVLWQMINIYLEEPGDQELCATYAPINTNELYFY